jgi:hypothetical protein
LGMKKFSGWKNVSFVGLARAICEGEADARASRRPTRNA